MHYQQSAKNQKNDAEDKMMRMQTNRLSANTWMKFKKFGENDVHR